MLVGESTQHPLESPQSAAPGGSDCLADSPLTYSYVSLPSKGKGARDEAPSLLPRYVDRLLALVVALSGKQRPYVVIEGRLDRFGLEDLKSLVRVL